MADGTIRVDVCVCTFRREAIVRTLESLAAQRLPPGLRLRAVVADNDETPSARERVEAAGARLGLDLRYVHAPQRNISVARNACLAAADAPLLAFIDDDEVAAPDWLAKLHAALMRDGADVVFGPVVAIYGQDAPRWLARSDLHSARATRRATQKVETGYTCNALVRREAIAGLRFREDLGRSGGEDTTFFHAAYRRGAKLAECHDAVVTEEVARGRANLPWLLRRAFRSGQSYTIMRQGRGPRWTAVALGKAAVCFGGAAVFLPRPHKAAQLLVRGALHLGVAAKSLGARDLQVYGG